MNEVKEVRRGIRDSKLIRGLLPVLLFASAPFAMAEDLPPLVPRIGRVFEESFERITSTSSVLVTMSVIERTSFGTTRVIRFRDPSGDDSQTEKSIFSGSQTPDILAFEDTVYLSSSYGGVTVVQRDAKVANRFYPMPSGWKFVAATRHFLVLAGTGHENSQDLRFVSASGFHHAGEVRTGLRLEKIIARGSDFLLYGKNSKNGRRTVATMAFPQLVSSKSTKGKLKKAKVTFEELLHFGPRFAVVRTGFREPLRLIAWGEAGTSSIHEIPADPARFSSVGWAEAEGALYHGPATGSPALTRITPGSRSATVGSIGLPAELANFKLLPGSGPWLHLGPVAAPNDRWVRLHPGNDRQLTLLSTSARERDGVMRFEIQLDAPSETEVRFSYETRAGSAEAGGDFTPISGVATLSPGQTLARIEVPLLEDFLIEPPESFELHLTGGTGARCDDEVATGRIIGSGARLIARESIPWEDFSNPAWRTSPSVRTLDFPQGRAVAKQIGLGTIEPFEVNSGRYFYAKGVSLDGRETWVCQFDALTGELLEKLPAASSWLIEGDQILLPRGGSSQTFDRYGFHDGFPVMSFAGSPVLENGGPQTLVSTSERSRLALDLTAVWLDPDTFGGALVFSQNPAGEVQLEVTPEDDGKVQFDRLADVVALATNRGTGQSSASLFQLVLADDDVALTTPIATGDRTTTAMAANDTRLWIGSSGTTQLQGFVFSDGALTPQQTFTLPKRHEFGDGIAFDGFRLAARTSKGNQFAIHSIPLGAGPRAKAKRQAVGVPASSQLLTGGYLVLGDSLSTEGNSGQVRVFDAATGKLLRVIDPPRPEAGFGHALAASGGILWVASPPVGNPDGRVYGYSLADFSRIRVLTSPEPLNRGVFGISIAADDGYLVVGEAVSAASGAAWVFSADEGTVLKRLASGSGNVLNGFGAQVATRSGRFLVGCGQISGSFTPATTVTAVRQARSVSIDYPGYPPAKWPVLLWMDHESTPVHLQSRSHGDFTFGSGERIALLDGCAVFTSAWSGGSRELQVHAFPQKPAPAGLSSAAASAGAPVWPEAGAPEPRWSFHRSDDGTFGAKVDPGGSSLSPANLQIEGSDDLRVWKPLADPGVLEVSWETRAEPKGFLRLRSLDK